MIVEEVFDSCPEVSISERSQAILEAINNLQSVKEFTDEFATDGELDQMIDELMQERRLIGPARRLLNFCCGLKNIRVASDIGDFI